MKTWHKLVIIPLLAATGFLAMLVVNLTLGDREAENLRQLSHAMEAIEEPKRLVSDTQPGFEDAAGARDVSMLAALAGKRARLLEVLDGTAANPILPHDEFVALRQAYEKYFPAAKDATEALARAEPTALAGGLSSDLASMMDLMMKLQAALEAALKASDTAVNDAFQVSGQMRATVTRWNAALAVISLLAIAALAFSVVLSINRTLGKVSRGFERMAVGDFAEPIGVDTSDELADLAKQANLMGDYLREMAAVAGDIADGDLRVRVAPRSERDSFGMAFERMVDSLRELVVQARETAMEINTASVEMIAASRQHEKGASEQASAVEEALRTIQQLLESSHQILEVAQNVLQNAEMTHKSNELVAERIGTLISHTERIAEILLTIKDIANKSDLLALNAGLEGIKAGETGRGFSLVASEMQRLAESVMNAVDNIKTLTGDIRQASTASVMATEEGTKLARDTTNSAERIGLIIQQQKYSLENVSNAMSDVSRVAREIATGATQSLQSLRVLGERAERQTSLIDRFRVLTTGE